MNPSAQAITAEHCAIELAEIREIVTDLRKRTCGMLTPAEAERRCLLALSIFSVSLKNQNANTAHEEIEFGTHDVLEIRPTRRERAAVRRAFDLVASEAVK